MGMLKKVISLWTWFWPWGTLWWISIYIMFCKWEFFAIYPLLILKESLDRTKRHRDLKLRIWDLYIITNYSLKYFFNILKRTSGSVAKTLIATKMGMLKKVISLWSLFYPWGTIWWISIDILICKWKFWFFLPTKLR